MWPAACAAGFFLSQYHNQTKTGERLSTCQCLLIMFPPSPCMQKAFIKDVFSNISEGFHYGKLFLDTICNLRLSQRQQQKTRANNGENVNQNIRHSFKLNTDVADTELQKSSRHFCKYCWPNLNYRKIYIFLAMHFQCKN